MKEELVSIVVPVHNVECYIERCLKSIRQQTYRNLEIILIDDGSIDDSGKICDKYAKIDKRITVIHRKNLGPSGARNIGIEIANGVYIAFLDADDFIRIDYIEILYRLIKHNDAEIAICNYIRGRKDCFPNIDKVAKVITYSKDEMLSNWHSSLKRLETVVWNKLYKMDLFKTSGIRYPQMCISGEDVQVTHQLVGCANRIVITDEILYYYYANSASITATVSDNKVRVNEAAQKERLKYFQDNGYQDAYERMLIKLQKYYMLMYCKLGKEDRDDCKKDLRNSFRKQYSNVNELKTTRKREKILFWSFKYFYGVYERIFLLWMR